MRATTRQTAAAKRQDPRPRPVDALTGMVSLRDQDPNLDYRWVPEIGFFDTAYYESMGWQKCLLQEGGVRPVRMGNTRKEGFITQLNQVLMCRPKVDVAQEYDDGQQDIDETEQRIFDVSFGRRLLQKFGARSGGYIDAVNESQRGNHG